ncbi:MAG: hypothetical protein ABIJ09_14295 [Pseudomonadota bacterium]
MIGSVSTLTLLLVAAAPASKGVPVNDEPGKIAVTYLKALDGSGTGDAREFLLGGVTLDAELATIPNWKILSRDTPRIEDASLADAVVEMKKLDAAGRKALDTILKSTKGEEIQEMGRAEAEAIMKPTQMQAKRFKEQFPLFAYVARVDKEVYWHPKNPWRAVLDKLGTKGQYKLEFHQFNIEETDHGKTRVWPLRVLRVKTDTYDSSWKILPASDWNPES